MVTSLKIAGYEKHHIIVYGAFNVPCIPPLSDFKLQIRTYAAVN
jgi:hypothetical protein